MYPVLRHELEALGWYDSGKAVRIWMREPGPKERSISLRVGWTELEKTKIPFNGSLVDVHREVVTEDGRKILKAYEATYYKG